MSNIFQAVGIIPLTEGKAFSCARGCNECRFAHEEPVDLHLAENRAFFSDVKAFFEKNTIQTSYLSANYFGDLIQDFDQYKEGCGILKENKLLEAGKNQMVDAFANMENYTENAGKKIGEFLRGWDYSITFSLSFSLRLDRGYPIVKNIISNICAFLKENTEILEEINLRINLELHGLHKEVLNEAEKSSLYLLLHKVYSLHHRISIRIPWELGKNNFRLFQKEISEVYAFTPLDACPYSTDEKLLVNDRSFLFHEFDIYKDAIRPHGKYCHAIQGMSIGTIYTEFHELKEQARLLKKAVTEISEEFQATKPKENVCEYCKERFSSFFPPR